MARAIIAVGSKEGKLYGVGTEIEGTNAVNQDNSGKCGDSK